MLKIFLNHATEDKALVMPYYHKLEALGFEPWIDKRILPGQEWDETIQKAFNAADVYLIFMSPRSVAKRGYVQREITDALEKQRYNLPGDIGLIPLMLEECEVPTRISRHYQYIRLPEGWHKVVEALNLAATQRSIAIHSGVEMGPFRLFLKQETERWEGLPGYEVSLSYPHLESSRVPNAAFELNAYLASLRLNFLLTARSAKVRQEEQRFRGWADSEGMTTSSSELSISSSIASPNIFGFSAHDDGMYAGAAHGYMVIQSHNFLIIDDQLVPLEFEDFFTDFYEARGPITELVRQRVGEEYSERFEQELGQDDLEMIKEALPEDGSIFSTYLINPAGFTLLYPQGQLFGHAAGAFGADLSFDELRHWLKPNGPHVHAQAAGQPASDVD